MSWDQHVSGLKDTLLTFQMLNSEMPRMVIKSSLKKCSQLAANELKNRAPVLTGNLKAKVNVKALPIVKDGEVTTMLIGASLLGPTHAKDGETDRSAYYIVMVENGFHTKKREVRAKEDTLRTYTTKAGYTYTRGSAGRKARYSEGSKFVPPNPFVKQSFDAVAPIIPSVFAKEFDKALQASLSGNSKGKRA